MNSFFLFGPFPLRLSRCSDGWVSPENTFGCFLVTSGHHSGQLNEFNLAVFTLDVFPEQPQRRFVFPSGIELSDCFNNFTIWGTFIKYCCTVMLLLGLVVYNESTVCYSQGCCAELVKWWLNTETRELWIGVVTNQDLEKLIWVFFCCFWFISDIREVMDWLKDCLGVSDLW